MKYNVYIKRKLLRRIHRLPKRVQDLFSKLVEDLETKGAVQPSWPNYSQLDNTTYHCHLTYRYIACWRHEKNAIIVEVTYVGSRENAPY